MCKENRGKRNLNLFARFDKFAPDVSLNLDGQQKFKTEFGGIVSILSIILFCSIVFSKYKAVLDGHVHNAFFTTKTKRDIDEPLDLMQLDYTFALETIDPSIASFKATQVFWEHGERKIRQEIPLVDCRNAPNTVGAITHEALARNRFYDGNPFLCPDTEHMILQGNLESDMFAYIDIEINGCQLPEDQCADLSEVDNHYLNMYFLTSHVDFTDFV